MISVSVFGVTGSIGATTAKLLLDNTEKFKVCVLTGGRNIKRLAKLAKQLHPKMVVAQRKKDIEELESLLSGTDIQVRAGRDAVLDAAAEPVDISVQAIVGFAGVETSLVAAQHAKTIALANKETLVCAGPMITALCKKYSTLLMPVDSEHSAIFQCLQGEDIRAVERVILTASGGPFLKFDKSELDRVTPEQAAAHPRWTMGKRISIDSASLFNKAMEMIEAHELFDVGADQIEVIIHPQSIIHSMIGFNDGALMAHLGPPDMAGAIGYALHYPDRALSKLERLDFAALGQLNFDAVDAEKFPAIELARNAMEQGGFAGAVFNAAKEQALDLFLAGQIKFPQMAELVARSLDEFAANGLAAEFSVDNLNGVDGQTRLFVQSTASKVF